MVELMHEQRGTTDGEQYRPLDQPRRADRPHRQERSRGGPAAATQSIAYAGGRALDTSDDSVDRCAPDRAGHRGGGVRGVDNEAGRIMCKIHLQLTHSPNSSESGYPRYAALNAGRAAGVAEREFLVVD